tara:strand:- start:3012 stop:3632 length:621 start_codon:yes stop_codon:yes gene_type:complete
MFKEIKKPKSITFFLKIKMSEIMETPQPTEIDLLRAEIETLRKENEELKSRVKPKKVKPVKIKCPFITAKGEQCRKFCAEGMQTCKVHSRPLKPPKKPKPPRPKRQACTGINIRGNPCRRKCLEGKTYCERHDPDNPIVPKKTKRALKKTTPVHNHLPGEKPETPCVLCQTHGDMFDMNVTAVQYVETPGEDGMTLSERVAEYDRT